jgi:N-acetylmannosamine-6-phosphate 2-epimerase/N-acetylmannosamine kinase
VPAGPLDHPAQVVSFAQAALASGARGLRIEGIANLKAVRAATDAPIIGLIKRDLDGSPIRITPFVDDVAALADAGADIIAFDATDRVRPVSAAALCAAAHAHGKLAMADISTLAEAKAALAFGADVVGTTMSGYAGGSEMVNPDFPLVAAAARLGAPVIAEGRIRVPEQAAEAMRLGAHSVVVGSAITRPEHITRWFADAIETASRQAARPALAFDLGGSKTLVALVEGGRVIDQREQATGRSDNPEVWCAAIAELAAPWKGAFDVIGGAVTGVATNGRWSALNPEILPVPPDFPLADALQARLGRVVTLHNDAQAAAWGEYRFGAGAGEDLVFVTVSTGVGGGVVLDGRLRVGSRGLAGSVGLTNAAFGDADGPLEAHAAGRFLAAAATKLGHPVEAPEIFAAAERGESWASALVDRSVEVMAGLFQNLQLLFDPTVIVLGGGIGLADSYRRRIKARLAQQPAALRPEIRAAALGKFAGVIGVADLALRTSRARGGS